MADSTSTSGKAAPDLARLRADVDQNASDSGARLRLGWGLFGSGDIAEALEVFQRGARDFPGEVEMLYGLGLSAKRLGRAEPASEAFRQVAEMAEKIADPARSAILHRLAMGHHNQVLTGRWGLKREVWGGD